MKSKSLARRHQILEAAIEGYFTRGVDRITFENIASACGVSRPLVQHYFPSKRVIFTQAIHYVRARFDAEAENAMQEHVSAKEKLRAYIQITFFWMRRCRGHAAVWTLFQYYARTHHFYRRMGDRFSRETHARIERLLQLGMTQEEFGCVSVAQSAHLIYTVLAGALMTSWPTESSQQQFEKSILQMCLQLAGAKT